MNGVLTAAVPVAMANAGRGTAAGGRFDAIDRAVSGARGVIEQLLDQALIGAALVNGRKINGANVFRGLLLPISSFTKNRFPLIEYRKEMPLCQ